MVNQKTVAVMRVMSDQRYGADLDKDMSFLQLSILQLIRFVGFVQRTDQLVYL